jgi:hypothetical protein
MSKMTDDKMILGLWNGLQKEHHMEIAEAVTRYCTGRTAEEVASLLDWSPISVYEHLDLYAIEVATCGSTSRGNHGMGSYAQGNFTLDDVRDVIERFAPDENNPEFEPFVDNYSMEGHTDEVAKRLARAEWAGEEAVEAGVIQECFKKKEKRAKRLLFPNDDAGFELKLRRHTANVKAATKFFDDAKINQLSRKTTCEKVLLMDAEWVEQVDRIRNLNSSNSDGV